MNNPNLTTSNNPVASNPSVIVVDSEYQPITETALIDKMNTLVGGCFIYLAIETVPSMPSTNNPYFGRVSKQTELNAYVGGNYETLVNNKMFAENMEKNFVADPSTVGEHISTCVQYNKKYNRHYLQYVSFKNSVIASRHYIDGVETDKAVLLPYLKTYAPSKKQPQENKIRIQSVMFSNINKLHINGVKYQVVR